MRASPRGPSHGCRHPPRQGGDPDRRDHHIGPGGLLPPRRTGVHHPVPLPIPGGPAAPPRANGVRPRPVGRLRHRAAALSLRDLLDELELPSAVIRLGWGRHFGMTGPLLCDAEHEEAHRHDRLLVPPGTPTATYADPPRASLRAAVGRGRRAHLRDTARAASGTAASGGQGPAGRRQRPAAGTVGGGPWRASVRRRAPSLGGTGLPDHRHDHRSAPLAGLRATGPGAGRGQHDGRRLPRAP